MACFPTDVPDDLEADIRRSGSATASRSATSRCRSGVELVTDPEATHHGRRPAADPPPGGGGGRAEAVEGEAVEGEAAEGEGEGETAKPATARADRASLRAPGLE